MRKYKKISTCPELLQEIIEMANLLPSNFEEIMKGENGLLQIKTIKDDLGERLFKYLFEAKSNDYYEKSEDLKKAKSLFLVFAQMSQKWLANEKHTPNNSVNFLKFLSVDYRKRTFEVLLGIDSEGVIKPCSSTLLEIFGNYNIPFYRIRTCEICSIIFWAKRLDSLVCSKKCSAVLSQRKYQQKNKGLINEKRRANYAYKQSKRSKINGNL